MYRIGLSDCFGFSLAHEEQPVPSAGVFPDGGSPDPRDPCSEPNPSVFPDGGPPDPRSVFPEGGPPDPCDFSLAHEEQPFPSAGVFPNGGSPDPCEVDVAKIKMENPKSVNMISVNMMRDPNNPCQNRC